MPDNHILPSADVDFEEDIKKEIWKQRAEHLAQTVEQKNESERIQLLLFRLGREIFGLEIKYINDIRVIDQVTPVPRMPDWVVGVIANRGRILTMIDLRRFFKLPEISAAENKTPDAGPTERFQVCVETPQMEIALAVDEVFSVEAIPANLIRNQPDVWGEVRPEYVRGITQYTGLATGRDAAYVVILNLPALLADEDLIIDEKIL